MATISFNITAGDIARITEAAAADGVASPKDWVATLVRGAVHRYEHTRDVEAAQQTIANYDASYAPVNPT